MHRLRWMGMLAVLGAGLRAEAALVLQNIRFDDPQAGPVTLRADVSGAGAGGAMVIWNAALDSGLLKLYREPDNLPPGATSWASDWNPYFRGRYDFRITAMDLPPSAPPAAYTPSHTVGTARAVSGTLTAIQYQTAVPGGAWAPLDTAKVALHCIGYNAGDAVASVGCNLLNADFEPAPGMTEEQIDVGYTDMGRHYRAGTPFRFDVHLHARPDSIMGMGGLTRFVWTPDDPGVPEGPGALEVTVVSASPWRRGYDAPLASHAGFAPTFFEEAEDAADYGGTLLCTTAHYMDVSPSLSEDETNRIGLVVSGQPGTTNYLQAFLPDRMLRSWGVTNLEDPDAVAGQLDYFVDGVQQDPAAAAPVVTRLAADSTVYEFDWDGDGTRDTGYLVRFTFVFPAEPGADVPLGGAAGVAAEIGRRSGTPPLGPLILANGRPGRLDVASGTPVTVAVSMNPGPYAGTPVDWWLVACATPANSPPAWYYMDGAGAVAPFDPAAPETCRPIYQGALVSLATRPLFTIAPAPGQYQFWFAVDYPMDGTLNLAGPIRMSTVTVRVVPAGGAAKPGP